MGRRVDRVRVDGETRDIERGRKEWRVGGLGRGKDW